jgi:hypothetical protein
MAMMAGRLSQAVLFAAEEVRCVQEFVMGFGRRGNGPSAVVEECALRNGEVWVCVTRWGIPWNMHTGILDKPHMYMSNSLVGFLQCFVGLVSFSDECFGEDMGGKEFANKIYE